MERQLERRREPEPVQYDRYMEDMWLVMKSERDRIASLPHVLKFNEMPWRQAAQCYWKHYVGYLPNERFKLAPLSGMTVSEQMLFRGSKSGKHRHFNEAVLFIVKGEGYEIHDDVKYPFETGDIVSVPTFCVHQHFNAVQETDVQVFFATAAPVCHLLGIQSTEQLEMHPNYKFPEGAKPINGPDGKAIGYRSAEGVDIRFGERNTQLQKALESRQASRFTGEVTNTYDWYRKTLTEQIDWRSSPTVPHVVKAKDRPWEDTPMGRLKYLSHATVPSGLLLFDVFYQEIPPGGHSAKHRHVSEEVHKTLDGRGYDIHDGKRWDWEKEDVVFIPPNTTHQHFNSDPHKSALFLAFQSRTYYYLGHGGIEHMEDASSWKR